MEMPPALSLLLATVLQQPGAASGPDPALACWKEFQQRMTVAQAILVEARITMEPQEAGADSGEADEIDDFDLVLTARIARNGSGAVGIRGTVRPAGGEETNWASSLLGTREGVFLADPEARSAEWHAEAWRDSEVGLYLPVLGEGWNLDPIEAESCEMLPPPAEHPDWRTVRISGPTFFAETATLDLTWDADSVLRRARKPEPDGSFLVLDFARFECLEEAAIEDWFAAIPEGWTVTTREMVEAQEDEEVEGEDGGLEEGLLPVGSAAPEALLIGMDDAEFALSSLRGKTVLLNFWFFH
jgi:hypothetical protein